jgi:glutamine amidotransferase
LIVVLDYGINNIRSVEKAVQHLGFQCSVQKDLGNASKLIIPGVGAFSEAMRQLDPVADEIRAFAGSGAPILGICLGQQLLFDSSEEHGACEGLSLIPGRVRYLPQLVHKVPHIGWSPVNFASKSRLGKGINPEERVYFVHSLYTECSEPSDIAAETDYGVLFPSAVEHNNVWGTQFHPEKSGEVGLRILRNFLEC